jgi:CHAD domain-containing protein
MFHKNFPKQILQGYLDRLRQDIKGLNDPQGIEALHQARVNARRLRMSIGFFKDQFSGEYLRSCRKDLRKFEKALGPSRDLDTELLFLTALSKGIKSPALVQGARRLLKQLHQEHTQLGPAVYQAVRTLKKKKTIKRMDKIIRLIPDYMPEAELAALIRKGGKKIQQRLDDMRSFERYAVKPGHANKLHQMRIAAKYLRYTMEIFRPFYSVHMDRYIESAHTVQNTLGDFHDTDVWAKSLVKQESRIKKKKGLRDGIRYFIDACEKSQPQKYRQFVITWKKMKQQDVWYNLTRYLLSHHPAR